MNLDAYLHAGLALLAAAFGCGAYAMALRSLRKELNGIGRKVNELDKKFDQQKLKTVLALEVFTPDKKDRELLAEILKD